MAAEALRDWANAFFGVTYCDAPWTSGVEAGVHLEGESQALPSERYQIARREYLEGTLPVHLGYITSMVQNSRSGWIASTQGPSFADFMLGEYLDQHRIFEPTVLDDAGGQDHAALRVFLERFEALPGVQRYRRSPQFLPEPIHNRFSHLHRGWVR